MFLIFIIKYRSASNICGNDKKFVTNCDLCVASYSCTALNPVDLKTEIDQKAPDSNPLGGGSLRFNATGLHVVSFYSLY